MEEAKREQRRALIAIILTLIVLCIAAMIFSHVTYDHPIFTGDPELAIEMFDNPPDLLIKLPTYVANLIR